MCWLVICSVEYKTQGNRIFYSVIKLNCATPGNRDSLSYSFHLNWVLLYHLFKPKMVVLEKFQYIIFVSLFCCYFFSRIDHLYLKSITDENFNFLMWITLGNFSQKTKSTKCNSTPSGRMHANFLDFRYAYERNKLQNSTDTTRKKVTSSIKIQLTILTDATETVCILFLSLDSAQNQFHL